VFDGYLAESEVVDWSHPAVQALADELRGNDGDAAVAARCFRWVRDEIRHSVDHGDRIVTLAASDVLRHRTGFCYAKSHLLAALLRANGIPAGFAYQRLSVDGTGAPFCLHGFVAAWLQEVGWYRADPRGNRPGISVDFAPPVEQLAFQPRLPGELTYREVWAEPLPAVVAALRGAESVEALAARLPDWRGGQTAADAP
jgi:transglutaminase-like putative cysteine protease